MQGAAKALEFYAEVFQATERMRFPGPDGTIARAEIQIGDSVVIVEDEVPERGTKAPPPNGGAGSPSFLFIYVANVDAVVARAVELGAKLQRPPEDQFYGDRDGYVIDPFGHGWTIATHVEDVEPQEMMRRMTEMQDHARPDLWGPGGDCATRVPYRRFRSVVRPARSRPGWCQRVIRPRRRQPVRHRREEADETT